MIVAELGEKPVWNSQQIDDVIAFLRTLTDQDVEDQLPVLSPAANTPSHRRPRFSSANRHAIPRSLSMPSKYPISSDRK